MVIRILTGSAPRTWHRHLDKGSLVAGVLIILVGLFHYYVSRDNERTHTVRYYRTAPVTPTQDYLAALGFTALGLVTSVIAIVHGRADPT
jgi:hypothetical protein